MKIVRASLYESYQHPPKHMVVRETDLAVLVEEALRSIGAPVPGALVVTEVFNLGGNPSIEEATEAAMRRWERRADDERNMAVLYLWNGMTLARVKPGGTLAPTKPAPLSVGDIEVAMRQLAYHPNYDDHYVEAYTESGSKVVLQHGQVRVMYSNPRR